MKKALGTIAIFFGIFAFAALASASTADLLQPASDVIYDENLIVNGTGIFDSIKVGKQGVGGVTFFNGTIINETTGENDDPVPVTIGDDVRIDGAIWRGANSGPGDSMPIKLNDDVNIYGKLEVSGTVNGLHIAKESPVTIVPHTYSVDSTVLLKTPTGGTSPELVPAKTVIGAAEINCSAGLRRTTTVNLSDLGVVPFSNQNSYIVLVSDDGGYPEDVASQAYAGGTYQQTANTFVIGMDCEGTYRAIVKWMAVGY